MTHTFRLESNRIYNEEPIAINQFGSPENQPPVTRRGANLHYAISARTERGTWRRAALAVCFGSEQAMSVDTYFYNAVGGARGTKKVTIGPREKQALCERNPIIETYGTSEPDFIEGRLAVLDAVSIEPVNAAAFEHRNVVRRNDIIRGEVPLTRISDPERAFGQAGLISLRAALTKALDEIDGKATPRRGRKREPADPETVLRKLSDRLERDLPTRESVEHLLAESEAKLGEESVAVQMVQETKPVIPRGTEMQQRLQCRDMSEAACGLLIAAMHHHAVNDPRIGGWRNAGCGGLVVREYRVLHLDGARWTEDAVLTVTPFEGIVIRPVAGRSLLRGMYEDWRDGDLGRFDFTYPGAE